VADATRSASSEEMIVMISNRFMTMICQDIHPSPKPERNHRTRMIHSHMWRTHSVQDLLSPDHSKCILYRASFIMLMRLQIL
jgi:hypothetical protein